MGRVSVGITGANGQLGQSFAHLQKQFADIDFIFLPKSRFDITNSQQIASLPHLDVLVNCAAYTKVDLAEEQRQTAYHINRDAVALLATTCRQRGIPVIHFSSDYVYHNNVRRPQRESDPTRPKGVYARSKLAGEKKLRQIWQQHLIFRVSWLYGPYGHNFPKTMLRLSKERTQFRIVNDQIGAPTSTLDLAHMVLTLIDRGAHHHSGTYNFCNRGTTSWDKMAQFIFETVGRSHIQVESIPSHAYPTAAKRPRNSRLDLGKFDRKFKIPIPTWQESMIKCLDILKTSGNL